jgi:hypothetical protein
MSTLIPSIRIHVIGTFQMMNTGTEDLYRAKDLVRDLLHQPRNCPGIEDIERVAIGKFVSIVLPDRMTFYSEKS